MTAFDRFALLALFCATLTACGGADSAGDTTAAAAPDATATLNGPDTDLAAEATETAAFADGAATETPADAEASDAVAPESRALAASASGFGMTSDSLYYTIDTGAGLTFKVRRTDTGSSTQSAGDIASLVYKGIEYQNASRGSQVNSGFDYLYQGVSTVKVDAALVDADHIKVTVKAGDLTHYYLARRGEARVYMATHFTREPDTLNLVRYIVRAKVSALPTGPVPSDLRATTSTIEAGDVFRQANGQTRSKHYSNMRLKDWRYFGATGPGVGLWFVRDGNEGNSGGPFFRSLLNQATSTDQELTYIVNYGQGQTEAFRPNVLNAYTLVFNGGEAPATVDNSWFASMGLVGYAGASARGAVAGVGVNGRDGVHGYTVGFSNARAQYWAEASDPKGYFKATGMLPGDYTVTVYKNELAVQKGMVHVDAGRTTVLNTLTVQNDPSTTAAVWRIGDWDGSPAELLNGDRLTQMHPSDVRMAAWTVPTFVVGQSNAKTAFPAAQWKAVNGTLAVQFTLRADQIANHTLRVGITTAFASGRPSVKVNQWTGPVPAASAQPSTRSLTTGTYRGNNSTFSYAVPASALKVGTNVLTLGVASGTTSTGFLSPSVSFDAVDLVRTP